MDETKAIAEKMKCMDLAERLGLTLGVNPVWIDKYVIYRVGLDDDYIELSFDLETGRWGIATGDHGFINLPKEAPDLMAGMSETIEETDGTDRRKD